MKKRLMGLFLGLSVMAMAAPQGNEDLKASADLQVKANVVAALNIQENEEMNFGDLVKGAFNVTAKGSMSITGEKGYNVKVTVPETVELNGDGGKMTVKLTSETGAQTLTDGKLIYGIDGKIATVNGEPGMYSEKVTVSVMYD